MKHETVQMCFDGDGGNADSKKTWHRFEMCEIYTCRSQMIDSCRQWVLQRSVSIILIHYTVLKLSIYRSPDLQNTHLNYPKWLCFQTNGWLLYLACQKLVCRTMVQTCGVGPVRQHVYCCLTTAHIINHTASSMYSNRSSHEFHQQHEKYLRKRMILQANKQRQMPHWNNTACAKTAPSTHNQLQLHYTQKQVRTR